jgi:F-type H+-transporting ATPase subunit b
MTAPLAATIAFIIFIAMLGYLGAHRKLIELLDDRTRKVKDDLTAAQSALAEAKALLADLANRREMAEREAAKIVKTAQERADEMMQEAAAQMAEFVRMRTGKAERRIALAEENARKRLQFLAMDVAVRAAEHVLTLEITPTKAAQMFSADVKELSARLKTEAF